MHAAGADAEPVAVDADVGFVLAKLEVVRLVVRIVQVTQPTARHPCRGRWCTGCPDVESMYRSTLWQRAQSEFGFVVLPGSCSPSGAAHEV